MPKLDPDDATPRCSNCYEPFIDRIPAEYPDDNLCSKCKEELEEKEE